jgi:hypothetical protein
MYTAMQLYLQNKDIARVGHRRERMQGRGKKLLGWGSNSSNWTTVALKFERGPSPQRKTEKSAPVQKSMIITIA